MHILHIEKDLATARSVQGMLLEHGFLVASTDSGEVGVRLAKQKPFDLILLEINLQGMSGFTVIEKLRNAQIKIPIIIVSGLGTTGHKVRGLALGADDYITKPFDKYELVARINAVLRRSGYNPKTRVQVGNLTINRVLKVVEIAGKYCPLTQKEYELLEFLLLNKEKPQGRRLIHQHLYTEPAGRPSANVISVRKNILRKKLHNAGWSGDVVTQNHTYVVTAV